MEQIYAGKKVLSSTRLLMEVVFISCWTLSNEFSTRFFKSSKETSWASVFQSAKYEINRLEMDIGAGQFVTSKPAELTSKSPPMPRMIFSRLPIESEAGLGNVQFILNDCDSNIDRKRKVSGGGLK
jgi:hypothetical protein